MATRETAISAVERLLGFFGPPDTPEPKILIAGMVALMAHYPEHLVARAIDPVQGLPAMFRFFPKIVDAKEILDKWYFTEQADAWRARKREQDRMAALPAPNDPEEDARMKQKWELLCNELRANISTRGY